MLQLFSLSLNSAILYRLGGVGYPYNTKVRDAGITTLYFIYCLTRIPPTPWNIFLLLLSCFALFGSLTTYHKWMNKFFHKPKSDVFWFNWLFTGFCYALSALPIVFITHGWVGFFARIILLPAIIMAWSELIGNVDLEEGGRGFWFFFTIPLILGGL